MRDNIVATIKERDERIVIRTETYVRFPLLDRNDILLGFWGDEDVCFLPDEGIIPKKGIKTFTTLGKFKQAVFKNAVSGLPVLYIVADKYGFMSIQESNGPYTPGCVGGIALKTTKKKKAGTRIEDRYPELYDAAEQLQAWSSGEVYYWSLQRRCKSCKQWEYTDVGGGDFYGRNWLHYVARSVADRIDNKALIEAVEQYAVQNSQRTTL